MTTLMVQGTASDVGKSVMVAGICRWLANQGVKVAPFKPQNMALNSAVTDEGLEIGRAQWVQAIAAKQKAQVDFNPVLLKPCSDTGAQVILHGKALTNMEAQQYHDYKKVAMDAVLTSHQRLEKQFEHIIVEGAGSPAEVNLREGDIANMGFAEAVDCPVLLVADIDKGGVFAQIVGTLALLSETERSRVAGLIINKFRGDIALLKPGLDWVETKTGKPVIGVLPYCAELHLAAEDAIESSQKSESALVKICVLGLSRISNHTDFDLLRLHPEVDLEFVMPGSDIPGCDLIMIPGTKAVIPDLHFIQEQGWLPQIQKHLRYGGKVFGICGGYQILGQAIADPQQVESQQTQAAGLGYLPIETELQQEKALRQVEGTLILAGSHCEVKGYEIHAGTTRVPNQQRPLLNLEFEGNSYSCGVISDDDQVAGCYLHGLFDTPEAIDLLLNWLGKTPSHQIQAFAQQQEQALDNLAANLEQHLDTQLIQRILAGEHHD